MAHASTRRSALADRGDVLYVAGGAEVYAAALPYADEQLISEVDLEPEGDTFYPAFDRRSGTRSAASRTTGSRWSAGAGRLRLRLAHPAWRSDNLRS